MADAFTTNLSTDILLLSTFLSGYQGYHLKYQPPDDQLALFGDISTLLTVSDSRGHGPQIMNAVMGKTTAEFMDFLVCAEDFMCNPASVQQTNLPAFGVTDIHSNVPTGSGSVGQDISTTSARELVHLMCPIPNKEHGRELLDVWNSPVLDDGHIIK